MEINSTAPVLQNQQTSSSLSGFFIWLSASSSISIIPVGIIILTMYHGSSFIFVSVISSLSFILIGLISIAGFYYRVPTMRISEFIFGEKFNKLISLLNWLVQVGWESISITIITFIIRSIIVRYGIINGQLNASIISLSLAIFLGFLVPVLGYKRIVFVQSITSFFILCYGTYTVVCYFPKINMNLIHSTHSFSQNISAVSVALMGGVFTWTMFSADYARYVSPNKSVFSVFKWPALGGFIGNFLLLMLAYVLYNNGGIIVNKSGILLDNNGFNGHYVFLTFSIFAITGLLMANFLTSYSSAFSVSTFLEKDYNRVILVIIDAFIATMVSVYLIFVSGSFIDAFEDFLSLGVLISAPWTSIFIIHVFTKIIFKINSLKIKTNIYLFLLSFVVELLVSYSNVIEYYLLPQGTLMGPILGFITPIVCSFVIIVWRTKLWQKLLQEKPLKQY